jgi:OHCU decarboxylase
VSAATTIGELDALGREAFVERLGFVAEGSPWVAREAYAARPFASVQALAAAFREAMEAAPRERQLALIRAHPDLAGRAAIARELTAESSAEQASAGLDRLTPAEHATFSERNAAYRERFGFPFVICVRDHDKAGILAAYAERLGHDREQEIATALDEIGRIVALRLSAAVAP